MEGHWACAGHSTCAGRGHEHETDPRSSRLLDEAPTFPWTEEASSRWCVGVHMVTLTTNISLIDHGCQRGHERRVTPSLVTSAAGAGVVAGRCVGRGVGAPERVAPGCGIERAHHVGGCRESGGGRFIEGYWPGLVPPEGLSWSPANGGQPVPGQEEVPFACTAHVCDEKPIALSVERRYPRGGQLFCGRVDSGSLVRLATQPVDLFFGTEQKPPVLPTVRGASAVLFQGCVCSPAPLIKRRRWGGEAVSASDRGGRICLPPKKTAPTVSADIVGGNGRCLFFGPRFASSSCHA